MTLKQCSLDHFYGISIETNQPIKNVCTVKSESPPQLTAKAECNSTYGSKTFKNCNHICMKKSV